jgi:myo-inositol 2-dehydrogenase/D-chiro-inositol 1-dehydrogenase
MQAMTIRVGFIGAGGIANAHLQVLRHMEGVRIAAFCDVDRERAESHAAAYNGRAYTDVHAMLDTEELEAVYICVPPHAHVGQEEAIIERGIPFFVEKPVANSLEKAESIAAAVEKAGLITSVGYHWRYMNYSQLARERLAGKTIGMALGYWMGGMPGVYWWRRQDLSGGQMVEQTTHIIDLARDLCGEIVEVYAAMSTRASSGVDNCTVTDVGTMTVKFASGAVGSISNTCLLKGFSYTVGLRVVTPDLVVEVDGGQFRALQAGREEIIKGGYSPYAEEDRVFIQAVQTGDGSAIRSPYRDAVRTLAVSLAANRSAETGAPMKL